MSKVTNEERRLREYLTTKEMEALLKAAKEHGRKAHRNYCLILLGYYHGLRASELVGMKWEQIDFDNASIFIRRTKGSLSGIHPLKGVELRALRKLQRETLNSKYLFPGSGGGVTHLSTVRFRQIMTELGAVAGLGNLTHPHMLRHSTGYFLAQSQDLRVIQAYLGHKNISNTVRYTALDSSRFDNIFPD